MKVIQISKDVISLVEKLSGRRVTVTEDASIQTLATVRTARGSLPFHEIRYRPAGKTLNYMIVYQLGFLVRLFSCSPESRWEVGASDAESRKAIEILGLQNLPPQSCSFLVSNLIIQLRTYSVGHRVDNWIEKEFPEIHDEQHASVRQQLLQNQQALAPEIRENFPKQILDANSAMNAAYALKWSERLGESRYFVPYKALGYSDSAFTLCRIAEEVSSEPIADRKLIEAWSAQLGLEETFHFKLHTFDD